MGKSGFTVIDSDGHVIEPGKLFPEYIDPAYRERVQRLLDWAASAKGVSHGGGGMLPFNYMAQGFERTGRRILGTRDVGDSLDPTHSVIGRSGGHHPAVRPNGGLEPHETHLDLQDLGIDQAVWFPSATTSALAVGEPDFELALCRAYNRWVADFCGAYPGEFKAVAVVPALDMDLAVEEIERVAREDWCVGVASWLKVGDKLADHPYWYPMYQALQDSDLALCAHAGTDRPPYPPARGELGDSYFLMHMTGHSWHQMRSMAALIGGAVFEEFPRLRAVFLESGCGWVVYWTERMDDHAESMDYTVPKLKRKPSEYVMSDQFFVSFEPDEISLPFVASVIGDDRLVFASDYPHFDAKIPGMVEQVTLREDLSNAQKRKFLAENARKLFTRLG